MRWRRGNGSNRLVRLHCTWARPQILRRWRTRLVRWCEMQSADSLTSLDPAGGLTLWMLTRRSASARGEGLGLTHTLTGLTHVMSFL